MSTGDAWAPLLESMIETAPHKKVVAILYFCGIAVMISFLMMNLFVVGR